ncbi:hypothetical protein EWI07_04280 [Sporolactobacillus sp. THM7-4]|nr:hypothetical protein EWI07_04280 [Sporolactobacillus sp. THM7-4]
MVVDRIETYSRYRKNETRTSRYTQKTRSKSSVQKFINSPKGIISAILLVVSIIGLFYSGGLMGIKNMILSVLTGLFTDFVVAWIKDRPKRFSDGGLVTGLIVGGILSPAVPWYLVMFTVAVSLILKHILKDKRKPIFNPAALGLLISATLFTASESWWSGMAMLSPWAVVFLIAGGILIVDRINKFPCVLTFLTTYMFFFLIMGLLDVPGSGEALRMPYINAALFLSFFMLTDPPTSPAKYPEQIFFGFFAAIVSGAAFIFFSKLSYLLVGLLAANGWKALVSKQEQGRAQRRKATRSY